MTQLPQPTLVDDDQLQALFKHRPNWPTVVGIISLCIGAAFLIIALFTLAANNDYRQPLPNGGTFPSTNDFVSRLSQNHRSIYSASEIVGPVNAALLILAGVLLMGRMPTAFPLHIAWCVVQFYNVITGIIIMSAMTTQVSEYMEKNMNRQSEQALRMLETRTNIGLVFGIILGLAYPGFLMFWFARGSIRDQIREWSHGTEA